MGDRLALVTECGRKGAARIAQGRDKDIDANRLTADADTLLAEIDLKLVIGGMVVVMIPVRIAPR